MSQRDHILKLLDIHRRSLQVLEEQRAMFGAQTPVHIVLQIENTEAEIARLERELASLEAAGGDAGVSGQEKQKPPQPSAPAGVAGVILGGVSAGGNISIGGITVNTSGQGAATTPPTPSATILFLAANPTDTVRLRLDQEVRGIDAALRRGEHRDAFELEQHWAVRAADLQELLLRHKPEVVHFSGHGSEAGEIMLEDSSGKAKAVSREALGRLFSVLKDNIRVVMLNACYSEPQAEAIAQHVDCVIGMTDAMGDAAAASFSAAFYQALAYGRSVQTAFDLACNQVLLEGLEDENVPRLLSPQKDPAQVVLVT